MSENKTNKTTDIIVLVILGLITVAAIAGAIVMIVLKANKPTPTPENPDTPTPIVTPDPLSKEPLYLTSSDYNNTAYTTGHVFRSSDELSAFVNSIGDYIDGTEDYNFNKYGYALVTVTYDGCEWADYKINYTESDSTYSVKITYDSSCGSCADTYDHYLIPIPRDKNTQLIPSSADIDIEYVYSGKSYCSVPDYPAEEKKPVIYLYPTQTLDVTVKLGRPELITSSYPQYTTDWQVTAEPSGKLTDKTTGRELYSLYWEGKNHQTKVHADGFVVKGTDTASFLEEKLATLGLTEREAEEFIIYWLPILEQNNYNYIRLETAAEINSYMPLEITQRPDTTIRVIMNYKPLNTPIKVTAQQLTTPTRTGFTVVEWGGAEIK